ncbi:Sec-independent protein translocase protein TatB [Rhodococcus marinonascens]|uniref:Sec-independent protein translocase protein TatB n=1 Tax=Rhodococcus marinonascens TaxID=38311 RepID=UPI00093416A3|nr:Sec-independent protein translocase protein TatB [Rhodococcus marinonascens]
MFGNIGWGEFMVLFVAALVILGPERLPGAVTWVTRSLKQVREYATGASQQLKDELGPEFDDLRKPLADLNQLRGMSPRTVITKHLLDGDDSILTGNFDKPSGGTIKKTPGTKAVSADPSTPTAPQNKPLTAGERPPIDLDAT